MKDPKVVEWEARQTQEVKDRAARLDALEAERRAAALDAAFTRCERQTAWNALHVAAAHFDENANVMRAAGQDGAADQFVKQAKDARELAQRIEP